MAHPEIHRIKEYLGEILIKLSYSEIEEILKKKEKMNQRSSALSPEALLKFEGYQTFPRSLRVIKLRPSE